ncbi:MAG TPA: SHOCT domain-containing protein, partial [Candidatus Methanoperedenaceae archaeon]|nr:SHOCT domain-containing protein [Candidatus Methanoperedenaceae archaeon]
MDGMMGDFGAGGVFLGLIFWILIVAGIVMLITWLAQQGRTVPKSEESAIDILKRRYAKGEITKENFEKPH